MENTTSNNTAEGEGGEQGVKMVYLALEVLVAIFAVIGNALVILVFYRERRLRRRTNYYIVSLAIADLLVGLLGIPFAILASMGLPKNLYACLFTVSLLVVLCTISIFCLVAVSVDRYWAILHPMGYSRNVRTKTAIVIIGVCWVSGTLVGFLPLLGWHKGQYMEVKCYFTEVMDYNYLVFLYFFTIIAPAILLAGFYAHIYSVVLKQLRQIVTMNPGGTGGGGTMLRMLGAARKREVKATQNLSIIVFFFIICWIPLYTINCIQAFCHECEISMMLTDFCIILSHINSAINPLLYAYHLRDFRAALKAFLCCIFERKQDSAPNETQAGRYGSHNTLHHHGVQTPSRNNSIQSLQQSRYQMSPVTETTAVSTKLSSGNSMINSSINTIVSSMGSIASLPLETESDGHRRRKRMWTLTEVSSACEDDAPNPTSNGLAVELRGDACGRKNQGEWVSGQVNSAYIEEGVILDYDEEGDDDVFIPENMTTLSVKDLNVQNRTSVNVNGINFNECTGVTDINQIHFELSVRNSKSGRDCEDCGTGNVVDEVSFQNQSESPLIAEIEKSNKILDDNEKTEFAKTDGSKKPLIVSCDVRNYNDKDETKSVHLVSKNSSSNCYEESNKSNTSPFNQRLSPLKIVGEFLFQSSNKRLNRFKEESSVDSCKESVITVEGTIDSSEAAQENTEVKDDLQNNSTLHVSETTQIEDAVTIPK